MKREEQIEVATAAYINCRLRNNVPPEEIEEIRLAYQAGAIYADLHVLNKGAAIGRREMLEKACEWLYKRQQVDFEVPNIEKFINDFKKAMEE